MTILVLGGEPYCSGFWDRGKVGISSGDPWIDICQLRQNDLRANLPQIMITHKFVSSCLTLLTTYVHKEAIHGLQIDRTLDYH